MVSLPALISRHPSRVRSAIVATLGVLVLLAGLTTAGPAHAAPLVREAATTLRLPATLESPGYTLVEAFPGLPLDSVVAMASPPGETNRLFLVEKAGRIVVITNLANPTRTVFLDLASRVESGGEAGLLGLAFHPDYRRNGRFFLFYTLNTSSLDGSGNRVSGLHDRISRFEADAQNPHRADAASEAVLIQQFDEASNHNGGDLHFGPDGYLYASLGDEGGGGDNYGNSQQIHRDFFAGIIRLDVDLRPGSLDPNPHPAIVGHYRIPPDNPFVGAVSFNGLPVPPAQVRTEFWAVGLRNPWRMAFDPVSGTLFCGDVGQGAREELNRIVRGGNYGWNFLEGTLPFSGFPPVGFQPIPPVLEYARPGSAPDPRRQGYSIIGGLFCHNSRLPELNGTYVFGDWGSGFIWAVEPGAGSDWTNPRSWSRLLAGPGMTSFGRNPANGDVLVAAYSVLRLAHSSEAQPPPATLAETGVFLDTASLTPAPGVLPYTVNAPFWSDHARKRRWFSVPSLQDRMTFQETDPWSFPAGTVWVKHFELETVRGNPDTARRIETRLLVKTPAGVYGLTYRWGGSPANATLVPADGFDEEFTIDDQGTSRRQLWRYPSRSECLSCHNAPAGHVLGFQTAQLNGPSPHSASGANQLDDLAAAGYFTRPLPPANQRPRLAAPDDLAAPIEQRVRSYLAANCAQCHRDNGPATGHWDARPEIPLARTGLIDGPLNDNGGQPGARVVSPGSLADSMLYQRLIRTGPGRMPPLGSSVVDEAGAALVAQWITNALPPPGRSRLTVETVGAGRVTGAAHGDWLTPGQTYTARAVPEAGHLFSHWSGSVTDSANPHRFTMAPGHILRAHFVTNIFKSLRGTYEGLAIESSPQPRPERSGTFTLTLQPSGTFSVRFLVDGQRLAKTERFSASGFGWCVIVDRSERIHWFEVTLPPPAKPGQTPVIVGRLHSPGATYSLEAVPAAPQPGRRLAWVSSPASTPPAGHLGHGHGTFISSAAGRVTVAGRLPDNTPFSMATVLPADGQFPFALLTSRRGSATSWLGWAILQPQTGTFTGSGQWTVRATDSGQVTSVPLPWSGAIPPASAPETTLTVVGQGGPLSSAWTNQVNLQAGRGTSTTPPWISLRLDSSGRISGTITDPGTTRAWPFSGAWLSDEQAGFGLIPGPAATGRVEIRR